MDDVILGSECSKSKQRQEILVDRMLYNDEMTGPRVVGIRSVRQIV